MMYIFEGVDHAGKDSLIDALKESRTRLNLPAIPMFDGSNVYDLKDCPPLVTNKSEFQKAIGWEVVRFCRQTNYDVIINRFTWSEIVYSSVLRNQADLDWYWDVMEEQLKDIAKIIYVKAKPSDIMLRIASSGRNKSDLIKQSIPSLLEKYDELIGKTKLDVIEVDTSNLDLFDFVEINSLQRRIFNE